MNIFTMARSWWKKVHPHRVKPRVEALEDRRLLAACPMISGYVYDDANGNGLFDPGEAPLAGSTVELRNAAGITVAQAITGPNGYYVFSHDATVDTSEHTLGTVLNFPGKTTNWSQSQSVAQFNPNLGTLTEVEIINHGSLTGQIKVESLDRAPQTITASVSGDLSLTGPGVSVVVASSSATETFHASAYDGHSDYSGTSGHDFGPQTVTGSRTALLTSAAALALFTGSGSVTFIEKATGTSSATSTGGNLQTLINNSAAADVTVVYHYLPSNCLQPGNYTIVQTQEPPGYIDGLDTRGNTVPLPNSIGTDSIPITLGSANLANNNFGEQRGSNLAGVVYYDPNNNGIQDAGEPGIPGVFVTLTGVDYTGAAVSRSVTTLGDGSYFFGGLRTGNYTITETQPAGYLQGKNSLGSLGGTAGNDQFFIALAEGQTGVEYNFGELLPVTVTNAQPPVHHRRLTKADFLSLPGQNNNPHGAHVHARHRRRHRNSG